ncbi:MAG: NADP oxidoreductase [Calditrichaeota bacterium]|nr:NADP oxidoreductase [Calditrichota bacterium]MCB9367328.1 NADP oxidoreductase [Calditrichota bacterium]
MSFLDTDERILGLLEHVEIVYSPLVDIKTFPENVDITLIEGSVSTNEDVVKIKKVRAHTKTLVALGDCAVTGNVPAMRNPFGVEATIDRAYFHLVQHNPLTPSEYLPRLLDKVVPVHDVVKVDFHVPGCPPPADTIYYALTELVRGRMPDIKLMTRFGK